MPLMSNPAGGEGSFTTYVKYNAKAGRFYTKKDEKDAPEFEVTNFTALMDLENVKTGWFLFAAGVAPAKTYDPSLSQAAAKPGEGFKRGFEVLCYSEKNLLGVREFSSTAGVVIDAINHVYDAWEAGRGANHGKLPVVKCAGVTPVTNKHGTNYQPQFEIVGWADRPSELTSEQTGQVQPVSAVAPSPAPAPVSAPPPPTDTGNDVEF